MPGLSQDFSVDKPNARGLSLDQVRKRFIRDASLIQDYPGLQVGAPALVVDAIVPAAIVATSDVTASLTRGRNIVPAGIVSTSDVSASLARTRNVAPAGITATSPIAAALQALHIVKPASITATSPVNASLQALHVIVPASITASSDVTAALTLSAALQAVGVLGAIHGLSQDPFIDIVGEGLVDLPQTRRRVIRRAGLDVDFWGTPGRSPALQALTPAAIIASSDIVATLAHLVAMHVAAITASSDFTGAFVPTTPVAPPAPTWSPFVDSRNVRDREYDPSGVGPRLQPRRRGPTRGRF